LLITLGKPDIGSRWSTGDTLYWTLDDRWVGPTGPEATLNACCGAAYPDDLRCLPMDTASRTDLDLDCSGTEAIYISNQVSKRISKAQF